MIGAGGRSDGARKSSPGGLPSIRQPPQPQGGLKFEPGVIVVLELGSQGQAQAVFNQGNIILDKAAEQVVVSTGRKKREGKSVLQIIADQAIAQTPEDFLSFPREAVLEIHIIGVQPTADRRFAAFGVVVVNLQRHIRSLREAALPAAQHIPPETGASKSNLRS